ncbi:MAG: galactonate dehydratase [Verrucomicrobia bacterium]|nr:galactonate dehydratase [Verrucomicrobiota bacterium]
MRLTRLETLHLRPRWLVVRLHTDTGLVGLGEATLEGRSLAVEAALGEMGRWLIGQDPRRIEYIWQHLYRGGFYRLGPVLCSALSGIDQALWDLLGKHLATPVHQLLGGAVRDRIRLYGWVNVTTTGDYIESAARLAAEQHFTAFKCTITDAMRPLESRARITEAAERFHALRQRLGDAIDIGVDLHGRCTPAVSRQIAHLLEPDHPLFLEEPVLGDDPAALRDLAAATRVPLATGERLYTRWQFQDLVAQRAVAVVQPDVAHAGGISELRRIAAAAEAREIAFAPHCPLGPVALAACLQLAAATPNFLCQEHVTLGETLLTEPFVVRDGFVAVPTGPGLGIALDEAKVATQRFDGKWDAPIWHHADGGLAEW